MRHARSKTAFKNAPRHDQPGISSDGLAIGAHSGQPPLLGIVAQSTPALIYIFDLRQQRLAYLNDYVAPLLGYTPRQLRGRGRPQQDMIHPQDRRLFRRLVGRLEKHPAGETGEIEFRVRRADGRWHWMLGKHAVFERDAAGKPTRILGVCLDFAFRRSARQRLLQLSNSRQRRIAQHMHDQLGQDLASVLCQAEALRQSLGQEAHPHARQARLIHDQLKSAITQTRSLVKTLCPVNPQAGGLPAALKDLAGATRTGQGVACTFSNKIDGQEVDYESAVHLYYIAQEAVHNALRHAGCSRIRIALEPTAGGTALTIDDNGRGLADAHLANGHPSKGREAKGRTAKARKPAARSTSGLATNGRLANGHASHEVGGIQIMRYRAGLVGGHLDITPRPRGGTRIRCVF